MPSDGGLDMNRRTLEARQRALPIEDRRLLAQAFQTRKRQLEATDRAKAERVLLRNQVGVLRRNGVPLATIALVIGTSKTWVSRCASATE
jgi:hypothetical protein